MRMISMLLSMDQSPHLRNLIDPSILLIFMLASYMRCCRFLLCFYGLVGYFGGAGVGHVAQMA